MAQNSIFSVYTDGWPSYYSTFIGFLAGWIGALPALYAKELKASPEKHAASTAGLVILVCLALIVMVYRITSDCEGFMSVSLGLLAGFAIGLLLVIFAAWISDRRATNVLGLPLIRNKAAEGQPIYVCERSAAATAGEKD
jgi:peptidoglycan/LPS O-acetylase OafA/YrhL